MESILEKKPDIQKRPRGRPKKYFTETERYMAALQQINKSKIKQKIEHDRIMELGRRYDKILKAEQGVVEPVLVNSLAARRRIEDDVSKKFWANVQFEDLLD